MIDQIQKVIADHETSYVARPPHAPVRVWEWSCTCGEHCELSSWEQCRQKTNEHWASKIVLIFNSAIAGAYKAAQKLVPEVVKQSRDFHGDMAITQVGSMLMKAISALTPVDALAETAAFWNLALEALSSQIAKNEPGDSQKTLHEKAITNSAILDCIGAIGKLKAPTEQSALNELLKTERTATWKLAQQCVESNWAYHEDKLTQNTPIEQVMPMPDWASSALDEVIKQRLNALLYPLPCGHAQFDWIDGKISPIMYVAPDAPYCRVCAAITKEHANHVQFASDVYCTLIDPLAVGEMKEADLFAACLKAAADNRQALRDAADDMLSGVTASLNAHWLFSIDCDHDKKTDVAQCACGKWRSEPMPTVGDAVKEWIKHALAVRDVELDRVRAKEAWTELQWYFDWDKRIHEVMRTKSGTASEHLDVLIVVLRECLDRLTSVKARAGVE